MRRTHSHQAVQPPMEEDRSHCRPAEVLAQRSSTAEVVEREQGARAQARRRAWSTRAMRAAVASSAPAPGDRPGLVLAASDWGWAPAHFGELVPGSGMIPKGEDRMGKATSCSRRELAAGCSRLTQKSCAQCMAPLANRSRLRYRCLKEEPKQVCIPTIQVVSHCDRTIRLCAACAT